MTKSEIIKAIKENGYTMAEIEEAENEYDNCQRGLDLIKFITSDLEAWQAFELLKILGVRELMEK